MTIRRIAVSVALVVIAACGGDDDGDDGGGPTIDAALGSDASEPAEDGGPTTACGVGDDRLICDATSEICVITDLGGGLLYSCETPPAGDCAAFRSCEACGADLCQEPADTCTPVDMDNAIRCDCLSC